MNVLVFNLAMDADHPTLGHATAWTNAIARRVERVTVITMLAGRIAVEPNVRVLSLGKELGRSEPMRLLLFYRLVWRALAESRVDACFAHMAPLFAALFAPMAKPRRIPTLLWFAHTSDTRTLRVAHALVDRCVTATPASFPFPSAKLDVVGHGIDTRMFQPPVRTGPSYERTAVSVGRITPIKRIEAMLEALAILRAERVEFELQLVGGPATPGDGEYEAGLRRAAKALRVQDLVTFAGPVPFGEVPQRYHAAGLGLSLGGGALDKAILEAMASGCLPVSSNVSFRTLAQRHGFDWLVATPDARGLASCILGVRDRTRVGREAIVDRLRRIVAEEHSLDLLSDRIVSHLTELAGR